MVATIDAHEGRGVGICNIPGEFISADMDEDVKMTLHRRLSEPMVNIEPQIYRQNAIYEKVRPFLYITLKKALYGCLRLAFLFYEQLVAEMRGKGFELNPYGKCVTNKMIRGKKMKIF